MSIRATLALSVALVATGASAVYAIPISELHENNSTGFPNKNGYRFEITGIVTSPDSVRSKVNTEVQVQDSTGGITLFQSSGIGAFHFNLGDSISIEGTVNAFNGLTQLGTLSNYVLHSTGNFAIDPLVLTCAQVNATLVISSPDSFPEANESRLIRINNVTRVSGTWPTTCPAPPTNPLLTIQDATGQTTLFIDRDSEVCGSPDPSGAFDVIGILSQFDTTDPRNGGYEIVPRYRTDIIPRTPGPSFLSGPTAVDVDSTSARIIWTTDTQSTSRVEYGLTVAYGSAAGDSTPVTSHSVMLTGLTPGRLYHYRASSTDGLGTRASGDFIFVTPSSTPGSIHFYFSHSIDPSLANPDTAQGNVYLVTPVLNRINAAQKDVSMAVYSFNVSAVADALIAAAGRGVKVRAIVDSGANQTQANRLIAAGIPVITSAYGGNHSNGGIHHNKFFVFDGRDTTSNTDDWVWTGSINMSNENQADANNGVEIQDYGLAQAYLTEFNEEWGSSTDTPNAALSRMGSRKSDNTPHFFTINGKSYELYFSPSDGTESKIVSAMNTAQHSIYFSIFAFTSNPIAAAMRSLYESVPMFAVRGVFDSGESNGQGSEYPEMSATGGSNPWSPPADVWKDAEADLLHHKYGIIDEGYPTDDPIVITGSHNWSNAANTVNDENTLIIHDARVANLYLQDFAERYHLAGGTADLHVVGVGERVLANGVRLSSPWPNPAGGAGTIEYALPGTVSPGERVSIRLYDLQGRLVRTLLDAPAQPGPQRVSFDASRAGNGRSRLAPGVYFVRLEALGTSLTQKWVWID